MASEKNEKGFKEQVVPPTPPSGWRTPTRLPDSVQGPSYSLPGAPQAHALGSPQEHKNTYPLFSREGGKVAAEGVRFTILQTSPNPRLLEPGSYRSAEMAWGQPLWAASYYSAAQSGAGIPEHLKASVGMPIRTAFGKGFIDSIHSPGFAAQQMIPLRLAVEQDGRMFYASGRTALRHNYMDWLGLFHRLDREKGFNPAVGQVGRLGSYGSNVAALTGADVAAFAGMQAQGRIPSLGASVNGRVWAGTTILRDAGKAGFSAAGGIGVVGGSWLEKSYASGALSSVESLGRAMVTASDDILWDWSRGVQVPKTSLELAHTIAGISRNFAGTYKERLELLQNYNAQTVAAWNAKFGVKAEAIYGEWENTLFAHEAKFGRGVTRPMDVLRLLTGGMKGDGGFVRQAYGKALEDLVVSRGLKRGTEAFTTELRSLEDLAAKMHLRQMSVTRTLSLAVGATMLDPQVISLLEKQDQGGLLGGLLHSTQRILRADMSHLDPGQTLPQLRAQLLERDLAGLAGGKANLLTFLSKRGGASLSLEIFAPGVRGDVVKGGAMQRQGFISISGSALAKHLQLVPGADARINWGRFESQRVIVPLGRIYDRETLEKALFRKSGKKLSQPVRDAIVDEWMKWGVGKNQLTLSAPEPGQDAFYFMRGMTSDGAYAGLGQVGGPLNLVQALAGHDEGRQVDATRAALISVQRDLEALGYKIYSDSSSSAETRSRGQVRLIPDNPHGIAAVAKNTGRHLQGALYPGKNKALSRRSPRMSFMAGDADYEEISRGTLTMRVAEMRGGIVNEDAAVVSRWAAEDLVGVEAPRNYKPTGQGKFLLSPAVEAAANLGKQTGRHVEYAVGADGAARLQVALGYYVKPENEQAYQQIVGKAKDLTQQIVEIYGARQDGWGKSLKELAQTHNVRLSEWMLGMAERADAFSARSMIQTELTTQMVEQAGIGHAIFERVAANQRLFYAGLNKNGIHTTIAQSYGLTKFTSLFGGAKALAHTVMNEMIYALPTGADLSEAVFHPLGKSIDDVWTTPFQFGQAVKATHRTRGMVNRMIASGELGAEWKLPSGWAGKSYLKSDGDVIESWVTRGWRGKVFSSTPHYWHRVMGDLGMQNVQGADSAMRGFGQRYLESYTGGVESRIRGAFGEATRELDAKAFQRGWARMAYGLGASAEDAIALATGKADTVTTGVGKLSLSGVKAADLSMREYTALFAASGVGGSFGTQATNLNPYNAMDRLKIQTLSLQRMQQMLNHEELGGLGQIDNHRLLRWATAFGSKYPLVEAMLHLKPNADSTSIDRFLYEPLITAMNDRGVGRTLLSDKNLYTQINQELKSRVGAELHVGRYGKGNKWAVSVNFLEADRAGEITLARGVAFKELLVSHGLLPATVADNLGHTLVGPTKYTRRGLGSPALGGARVAASKDFALAVHDAALVMTDTLDYGMGTKEWSDLNRKDVAIHLRGFAEVAKRLTGGKLTERQSMDFSSWYLLQHMRPSSDIETVRTFGAGLVDFEKAMEVTSIYGKGKGLLDIFRRVATEVPGKSAGIPMLEAQDVIAHIEKSLSGGLLRSSDEQVMAYLKATYGKDLTKGFRLDLSHYGVLEHKQTLGSRILDQFMERVIPRFNGDPGLLRAAHEKMSEFLGGPNSVRLYTNEVRPTLGGGTETVAVLKDVAKVAGKYSKTLPLNKTAVYVSPLVGENSLFNPMANGAEEIASSASRHLVGMLRGLAHPGHQLDGDDAVSGFVDALSSVTAAPGDEFFDAQIKNATSQVQGGVGRSVSKTARHIEALTEMHAKPVAEAIRSSVGKIQSQRAYIAPLITREKFLGLLDQARAAGYSDINMIVGGNSALVSDSSVLLGFDNAKRAVNVMMSEDNAKAMRALLTLGRQPSIYNWSYYNASGKYHAGFPFGVMGAESSLTAQLHVGDNDSDTMANLLFKDPAKLLRRWLGKNGMRDVQVGKLSKEMLAAERAVSVGSRAMNKMLTDGILASIFEKDGNATLGQTNLAWAHNIAVASLESLGVKDADREVSQGIFRIVSPLIRAAGAHHLATADAAKAELQKNLTGVADSLLMSLPGAIDTIHGRLLDAADSEANRAMGEGLGLFEKHFGADRGALLGVGRIFQQTAGADYSQAFIGGKHGYTSFIGNMLPVMALSTADEEALALLGKKPGMLENAVRGLIEPGQYSNFRAFLQSEVAHPFTRENVAGAFDKAFGSMDAEAAAKGRGYLEAIRTAATSADFDDDLLIKSVKGLHSVMMSEGQLGSLADVVTPLAYAESYEKEKKLLAPLKMKDGRITLGGHWAEGAKMVADQLGLSTEEVEDRWVKGSMGYIREVARAIDEDRPLEGAGRKWWEKVLASKDVRQRIFKDDLYAASAGMQLLGPYAAAVVGETSQHELDYSTPFKGETHRRNRSAVSEALTPAKELKAIEGALDRSVAVNEYTAVMDWENLVPQEENYHPTASGYMGRVNKTMLTAEPGERGAGFDPEAYEARQKRGKPSAVVAVNNALADAGSEVGGKGLPQETGPSRAITAAVTAQETTATAKQRIRVEAPIVDAGVATPLLEQGGRAGEEGLENKVARSVGGLLGSPKIVGGAIAGGIMAAGLLMGSGGNQPSSDGGFPKFSDSTLDDYQSVVDEVLPNPSPVKVQPYRNSYGMASDQRMKMNGVDDGMLNTLSRTLAPGSSNTKLVVRDQSQSHKRWMLRREVDQHMASPY